MLFYSFEFMYFFFPMAIIGYFLFGKIGKHPAIIWLVISSVFFYGWWNPLYVFFLVGSMLFNYLWGVLLRSRHNKALLVTGICLNLGCIAYFKYFAFFSSILQDVSGLSLSVGNILLPLGISFFTFQQIAWLIDNYSGQVSSKDRGIWEYCLFVSFFPQLIAGPIVHHSEMMPQFHEKKNRFLNYENLAIGITVFVIGLAKKVVVADSIAPYANMVFDAAKDGAEIGFAEAWIGALSYSMQLYFDFSGYADMAIGLALMFNIHLPLNFESPYKSINIGEFWRRWHITLGRFLRDYVYIPMGGSRCVESRRYFNLMATMLICGLWHGAGWNFIFWGGLHGLFLIINRLWSKVCNIRLHWALACAVTYISVVSAWVFFRAETFQSALAILQGMVDFQSIGQGISQEGSQLAEGVKFLLMALALTFFFPNTQELMSPSRVGIRIFKVSGNIPYIPVPGWQTNLAWLGFVMLLSLSSLYCLLDQTTVQEFIYFQF
jgi:D-alanyl-lipoteichoic acid acyltransferase DltB (MBOAT superfamily)